MAITLDISICSETGMGSFVVTIDDDRTKADLMPDEVVEIKEIAETDASKLRDYLSNIEPSFSEKLSSFSDDDLKKHVQNPACNI